MVSIERTTAIKNILNKVGIIVPILFILVSLFININSAYNLDFLLKYGSREKTECGNEYMEIETPNYQVYNALSSNSALSKSMRNAFILVQVAWVILVTGIIITILSDINIIYQTIKNTPNSSYYLLVILIGFIVFSTYLIYIAVYSVNINGLVSNMSVADIGTNSNNTSKLLGLYLPTLTLLLPILWIGFNNNIDGFDSVYFIYALLFILVVSIAIQYNSTSLNLFSTVNSSYSSNIDTIQANIRSIIGTTNAENMPLLPPQTSSDRLKIDLIKNIKSVETVDGDNFILHDYNQFYWKYLMHQNGNELSDIYQDTTVQSNVKNIRTQMRNLRNNTSIQTATTSFTNSTIQFAIVILSLLIYIIFHFFYKHVGKPITATLIVAFITFLLLIIGPLYGWIVRVAAKMN